MLQKAVSSWSSMPKFPSIQFFLSSLRTRLILLVLLAVLPALGITFYTTDRHRRLAASDVTEAALRITRLAAADEEQLIQSTHQILITLAQLPQVHSNNSRTCNTFFANLRRKYALYTIFGVIDTKGYASCSSPSLMRRVYLGDRPYFKKALQTKNFALGKYQIGRISGKASINFGYPILAKNGNVQAVVFAGLDLNWLNQLVAKAQLPRGAALTVIDQDGTILARNLNPQTWIGKSALGTPLYKTILTHNGEGTAEVHDVDGIRRLYAFTPLRSAPEGSKVYVSLGVPTAVAFANVNQMLVHNLSALGLAAILALVAIWFGSNVLILRQVDALVSATKRLKAGELSARTGVGQGQGELSELAASFDNMAASLERNLIERNQASETLKASEAGLRALFAAMNDIIVVLSWKGLYLKIAPTNPDSSYNFNADLIGKTVYDVLPKPQADTFIECIRRALDLQQTIQVEYSLEINNKEVWFAAGVSPLSEDSVIWVARDITERKQAEQQLLHNALHDVLTGLSNRALFMERLKQSLERVKQHPDYLFAVLFLDFDRFKVINDSLGHLVGDQLLIAIARKLEKCVRPGDTIARLGGDEFAMLLEDIKDSSDATQAADRIHKVLTLPFNLSGHEVFTSASIGIALGGPEYDRPEDLLRDADTAMYRAKALGKACHELFTPCMHTRAVALLKLENDLQRAIKHEQFEIYYQPIVSLKDSKIVGFEALLRWQHPVQGLLYPTEFISVAEETGLIVPIGWWVLREACHQMCLWQAQFPINPPWSISINISGKQFLQPELINPHLSL